MDSKTIVILGGGVGGLVVANELRRLLPREHGITLIEKKPIHAFAPSFLWLMTGDRSPQEVCQETRRLLRPGVSVIHSAVTGIDCTSKEIKTTDYTLRFDYLIVALGTEMRPDRIPGLAEAAHSFYTFEGADALRQSLESFAGGKIALVVSSLPYKCPGAPHEAAMLIADYFKRRGMRDKVDVHLYTPEPQPMPVAGPELGGAVVQMLSSRNISFHPLHKLVAVDPVRHELTFESREPIQYDLLIAIPPHVAPEVVRSSGLSNESGWIPVDRTTLKTKFENVFAIGDVTAISIPGRWKPDVPMMLPKAGVFAHAQAEIVASRIADEIDGRTPRAEFCGPGYCMLEAGEDLAGFAYGDFFAEPTPRLELRQVRWSWHFGKVLFEKWWLSSFGWKRSILGWALNIGSKLMRVPIKAA